MKIPKWVMEHRAKIATIATLVAGVIEKKYSVLEAVISLLAPK